MILIMLGPPGSGKGTVAGKLASDYPYIHVSTGDLFRKNIKEKTPLGLKISSYIEKGALVPDEVAVELITDFLANVSDGENIILDGFPRTLVQAEKLDTILAQSGQAIGLVLHIHVADEIIIDRVLGRRQCSSCGQVFNIATLSDEKTCPICEGELEIRSDDRQEVVVSRLKTYHELTAPLVEYYREQGKLRTFDNTGTIGEVVDKIVKAIELKTHE